MTTKTQTSSQSTETIKPFYLNKAQQLAYLIDAPYAMHNLGRGTGKSEGILAPSIERNIKRMPRGTRLLVAATFQQILTRTLPPMVAAWQRMGYKLGEHFLVGEKPSEKWKKKWGWPGPLRPIFDYRHTIVWWNGSINLMVSQDRIGTSNGTSVDGIDGDEAKLLNAERLRQETFPANRGPVKEFQDCPHHHGWTFCTDMPMGRAGQWIIKMEEQCDYGKVKQVLRFESIRHQLLTDMAKAKESGKVRIGKQLKLVDRHLKDLRKGLVYYQQGSSLLNIDALGVDYIRRMSRDLTESEMLHAILGVKPKMVEGAFYNDFDEEKHGYFAYDYHTFENVGYNFEKLKAADNLQVDKDYDPDLPLHIALDYNKRITPMVIAQVSDDVIRVINAIHRLEPAKLNDTLEAFVSYYRTHPNKVLYFWYDQTTTSEYAHTSKAQYEEVVAYLSKRGWKVEQRYIGAASEHERRYTMYSHLFTESGKYPYKFRINRERCKFLIISMNNTQTVNRGRGFRKDKTTELKKNYPAEESSHYSEALDMMVWGILESGLNFVTIHKGAGSLFLFGR